MKSKRIITFVPAEHAEDFAAKMADQIPHLFGEYDSVCWWSEPKTEHGTEQYRPLNGELQKPPSVRMEFSIPDDVHVQNTFIKALNNSHPWDQPVILTIDANITEY